MNDIRVRKNKEFRDKLIKQARINNIKEQIRQTLIAHQDAVEATGGNFPSLDHEVEATFLQLNNYKRYIV